MPTGSRTARRLAVMANYFEHVLELPLAFHTSTHSGRVLKVMLEGSNGMAWLWLGFFREHFSALVALVVLLPLTLFLNWRLGLLLVLLVVVFTILTTLVLRKTETLQGSVERYHSSLAEHASDALGNVPVIQSFTRIEAEARALRGIIHQLLQAQNPVLSWWALASVATRASATDHGDGDLPRRHLAAPQGLATIGEVVTFMSIATMLIGRLEQAVELHQPALHAGAEDARVLRDPRHRAGRARQAARQERRALPRRRRLRGRELLLRRQARRGAGRVRSRCEPGETVALVGATGSGKSTTLGLLHRAFDPQSGVIRIDGDDIRDLTLSSLRRNIGVVFQEPMLFARSIRENLQVGRPDATDEEMIEGARARPGARIHHAPDRRLDTIIGERGRSLSGGERQRLSIARALLKNPPILILDEATSALDAATERKLQQALDEVMKGRTTFVIAHRLATIRNADRILVFDQGRIVETGSFDELVAKGGRFAELARAQFMAGRRGDTPKKRKMPRRRRGRGDVSARPVEFVSAPSS